MQDVIFLRNSSSLPLKTWQQAMCLVCIHWKNYNNNKNYKPIFIPKYFDYLIRTLIPMSFLSFFIFPLQRSL